MSTSSPQWTILIPTLGQRSAQFSLLLSTLLIQARPYRGRVTVCALWNNGERPLSKLRQALVESAQSRYVSFIDDDDWVPHYHVREVMRCLESDVDYVGWRMQCTWAGKVLKPTYHSLEHFGWWDDRRGYYRDISHLNPIRTELARSVDFRLGEPPEDASWADQLRAKQTVRRQCYIDRVMYEYRASSDSTWRWGSVTPVLADTYVKPVFEDPNFKYHRWST